MEYGPVLTEVRSEYMTGNMFAGTYDALTEDEVQLVNDVFNRYDEYDSWQLSTLSHSETSWLKAREGLKNGRAWKK